MSDKVMNMDATLMKTGELLTVFNTWLYGQSEHIEHIRQMSERFEEHFKAVYKIEDMNPGEQTIYVGAFAQLKHLLNRPLMKD